MTLETDVIRDDALRATDEGLELDLLISWYRSLPLSSVKSVEISLDGEPVPSEDLSFVLEDHEYALGELPQHHHVWWFELDRATLRIKRSPALEPGETVQVDVGLTLRIPYIMIGPTEPLEVPTYVSRRLTAR